MNMRTSCKMPLRAALVATAVAATLSGMSGCLSSSDGDKDVDQDGDKSGNPTLFEFLAEVLDITPPQGSEPGRLAIRATEYYCEDDGEAFLPGPPQSETFVDDIVYVIDGGKLYLWDPGSCMADVFSGNSSGVTGTWKGEEGQERVPAAYRASRCTPAYYVDCEEYGDCDDGSFYADPFFDEVSLSLAISADSMKLKTTGKVCMARAWAMEAADHSPGAELVSSGCSSSEVLLGTGKAAKYTSSLENDVLSLSVRYNGKTCTRTEPFAPITAETECSDWEAGFSGGFYDCLEEAGYFEAAYGDDWRLALEKKSPGTRKVPGMSMLRR